MRLTHLAGFLSLLAVATLASPAAFADTTYTYTSSPYTSVSGLYTTAESVTFSFTVATPLQDNLTNRNINPTSFSLTDGEITICNGTGCIPGSSLNSLVLTTSGTGVITDWNILGTLPNTDEIQVVGQSEIAEDHDFGIFSLAQTQTDNGVWTSTNPNLTSTPEPSSLILLGTGALGLLGAARRRFRRT